ncbi:MAG: 50S ribosomal protein L23 [Nanoarchaeota archaeon]|nr:50S ribosomal protein L23 [Nanoarchaeota archaeon]MBU1051617.1 50S ribosomal protein L23 [Nanoarchaeota archaeon]MBU1988888.1 50S ribosomal protein L23 [Nanoarchaeota archaeon]
MILKPITSEKAVKLVDLDNTLIFKVEKKETKETIKKEVEKIFNVKVDKVRTLIRQNKKYAYVKFAKANPAIDIATKLGMI